MNPALEASVVIPTHNRPDDLARCLSALARQDTRRPYEVIVVDDGSSPPLGADIGPQELDLHVVRTTGLGPAGARNAGLHAAQADIVLFTDDDTEPAASWVEAACRFLQDHAEAVGVEGRVVTPPFDPLHAYSISNELSGAYWTCNIGYRRAPLVEIGGFYSGFPYAHCEDRDLGHRALAHGPIGFVPEMEVLHHPRTLSLRSYIRRGRMASSELVFWARHPHLRPGPSWFPDVLLPPALIAQGWYRLARRLRISPRSPRRLGRLVVLAAGQIGSATLSVARRRRAAR